VIKKWDEAMKKQCISILGAAALGLFLSLHREVSGFQPDREKTESGPVPSIIKQLSNKDEEVRARAADQLGDFGPKAATAVPSLLTALNDTSPRVRGAVIHALGKIGPAARAAIPAVVAALEDPKSECRCEVPDAIQGLGGEAIPYLLRSIDKNPPYVRAGAITALGKLGPKASASLPKIRPAFNDRDRDVRSAAAVALIRIQGKEAVADVSDVLLRESDPIVTLRLVDLFSNLGRDARGAVPALIATMKREGDEFVESRVGASFALSRIGEPALAPLAKVYRDTKLPPTIRATALESVRYMGSDAKAAVPDLVATLRDADEKIRGYAAEALGAIGPGATEAVAPLTRLVNSGTARDRITAATSLAKVAPDNKLGVSTLSEALHARDKSIRLFAAASLQGLGPQAEPAVLALITLLKDKDVDIRLAGIHVLEWLGPRAKAAIPALRNATLDDDREVRRAALKALANVQGAH
jgi:HEAT repeat protein